MAERQSPSKLYQIKFNSTLKMNRKLGHDLSPVPFRRGPLYSDVFDCQIKKLKKCVIRRKHRSIFRHFPHLAMEIFHNVRCVYDIPDGW